MRHENEKGETFFLKLKDILMKALKAGSDTGWFG